MTKAASFLPEGTVENYASRANEANKALAEGTCPGNDFLGWVKLPSSITPDFIAEINDCAQVLRQNCDTIVVAGMLITPKRLVLR